MNLRLPEDPTPWPPEVATTVHRIVQESLTSIARYAAHARSATVDVTHGPDGVTVTVSDDAPPGHARPGHHGGFGLIGMRERVEALGGHLSAGPGRHTGWSVRAYAAAERAKTDVLASVLEDIATSRYPAPESGVLWETARDAHLTRLADEQPRVA